MASLPSLSVIEYDPNRTAHIALLKYMPMASVATSSPPRALLPGDQLLSGAGRAHQGRQHTCRCVTCRSVARYPLCIELKPGKGAQIAALVRVPPLSWSPAKAPTLTRASAFSGEMRKVLSECRATLGEVSNGEHSLRSLGKAGATRWRGVRPTVRGVAMNPVDHPHGGGEGRTSGGRHPVSPWGVQDQGSQDALQQAYRQDDCTSSQREVILERGFD